MILSRRWVFVYAASGQLHGSLCDRLAPQSGFDSETVVALIAQEALVVVVLLDVVGDEAEVVVVIANGAHVKIG